MHPILRRQLRQLGNPPEWREDPRLARFLELVERAYEELESDRRFAEHNLQTVSEELFEANETIRKETERQIASQEAQLAMALHSSGDGLWSWDAKSQRLEFSPSWIQMLGYDVSELPSDYSACAHLIHPEDWKDAPSAIRDALSRDEIFTKEMRVLRRSGEPLWVLARGRVVERDAAGRPLRLVGTVMNITAQKQIEEDLRTAKENAELANDAKSRFLAVMSHEIRTPMNGVIGFADLLAGTPLSPLQKEYLDLIQSSGKMLMEIITDILDFSRIESGVFALTSERFCPSAVASGICDLLRAQAESKNVTLEFSDRQNAAAGDFGGDSLRFRQILLNLLGNAVKFTATGRIDVTIARDRGAGNRSWLLLEVRDTGAGIPPEHLPAIFEPFAQGDMSITRKYGGTGLGLAITKRLVELMGGAIEVESIPDAGSVFRVRLPDREDAPVPPAKKDAEMAADAEKILPKVRALIVEDNRISRLLAERFLQSLGCEVAVAEDGSQAVEIVKEADFDVIFMDMSMPVMDGLTATRLIREIPGREHLPIIAISANAQEADRALCLQAGMDDFISKPYKKKAIFTVLSQKLPERIKNLIRP